jgi:hypothetical protein
LWYIIIGGDVMELASIGKGIVLVAIAIILVAIAIICSDLVKSSTSTNSFITFTVFTLLASVLGLYYTLTLLAGILLG